MEIKHCKRCGEEWCYRGGGEPIRCGKCKSPYWDRESASVGDDRAVRIATKSEPLVRAYVDAAMESCPEARVCASCEGSLQEKKGKMVCMDGSCGMYGQEQKGRGY